MINQKLIQKKDKNLQNKEIFIKNIEKKTCNIIFI